MALRSSPFERLPRDILLMIAQYLGSVTDLCRLQRCSRTFHAVFSHNNLWSRVVLLAGGSENLCPKIASRQTLALLLLAQSRYRAASGGSLRLFLEAGALRFALSGLLAPGLFCMASGDAVGRVRAPKPSDPRLEFITPPKHVFVITLYPCKSPPVKTDNRKVSLIFIAPGKLALRRSNWVSLTLGDRWHMTADPDGQDTQRCTIV